MSTKKEQRALKKPDLFQIRGRQLLERLKQNPQSLVGIVILVAVFVGGYFLNRYYSNLQIEKRASALWSVDKLYEKELEEAQEKSLELYTKANKLGDSITKLEKEKNGKEKHKTEIAKLSAEKSKLEKLVPGIKPSHGPSSEAYLQFFKENKGTPEGARAATHVIKHLTKEKKYDKALELVKTILAQTSPASLFYPSLLKLHIKLLSETSNLELALSETEKLIAVNSDSEKAQSLLTKGALLVQAGKLAEAEKIFDTVITDFHATSDLKLQARAYKALIF